MSLTSLNLNKYDLASSYLVKDELYRLNSLHLSCLKKNKKHPIKFKSRYRSLIAADLFSSCIFSFPTLGRWAGGEEEWAASVCPEGAQQPRPASEAASHLSHQTHHCGVPVWLGGQRGVNGSHVHYLTQAVLLFAYHHRLFFCLRKWWDVARKWRWSPILIIKTGSFRPSVGWLKPSRGHALWFHHQILRPWIK